LTLTFELASYLA